MSQDGAVRGMGQRLRTAGRLLRGWCTLRPALRPSWARRSAALDAAQAVSFDIFNTLLFQDPGLEAQVQQAVCAEIVRLMRRQAWPEVPTATALQRSLLQHHQRLCQAQPGRPARDEVPRREVYEALFCAGADAALAATLAQELLHVEMQWHQRLTAPNPQVLEFLQQARARGLPILATSDTYLGQPELRQLLAHHGIDGIGHVHASCEHGADKFHGRLFEAVLAHEGLAPQHLLHVGDNPWADICSARACGIPALHYRPRLPGPPPAAPPGDAAYQLGFTTLGPVFDSFARLLLAHARRRGIQRLAFVSRDGDLLRQAVAQHAAVPARLTLPQLDYVHFSRRSTALPAARQLDAAALRRMQRIRGPGTPLDQLLDFHAIPREHMPPALAQALGQLPAATALADPRLATLVHEASLAQVALLADYMRQQHLDADPAAALVDVGWRGTIQQALHQAFAHDPAFRPLPAFYLGLWDSDGAASPAAADRVGLLGDMQRGRSLLEAAPWHLALVLEPVCRAAHGTVLGYRRQDDGQVLPVLAEHQAARQHEQAREAVAAAIRRGVLAYVEAARTAGVPPGQHAQLRRRAQWRMLRLAFFPARWEIDVLASMVHTESHIADWSPLLVSEHRPSPWRQPRRWLAGLASPWRGGYVAATGGPVFSLAYLCAEAVLAASPALGRRVQALARRWAGI